MITKEKENFNFNFIKNYNIDNIVKIVETFSNEWKLNTSRQDQKDQTHNKTNTYFIRGMDQSWIPYQELKTIALSTSVELLIEINKIIKDLEVYHDGKCGMAMIVKLFSDAEILEHSDGSPYLSAVRRHHIPLKTNDNVLFFIDNESMNLKIGDCWEINNNKLHKVINKSDQDRIHLMIDIVPNKYIGEQNA
jgi:hypothetical protein